MGRGGKRSSCIPSTHSPSPHFRHTCQVQLPFHTCPHPFHTCPHPWHAPLPWHLVCHWSSRTAASPPLPKQSTPAPLPRHPVCMSFSFLRAAVASQILRCTEERGGRGRGGRPRYCRSCAAQGSGVGGRGDGGAWHGRYCVQCSGGRWMVWVGAVGSVAANQVALPPSLQPTLHTFFHTCSTAFCLA